MNLQKMLHTWNTTSIQSDCYSLTPSNNWDDDDVFGGDMSEHDDQFLEHEQCLSSHPGHRGHAEVLDDHGAESAANFILSSVDAHQEDKQHEEHGYAELNVELAGISFADFPKKQKILSPVLCMYM